MVSHVKEEMLDASGQVGEGTAGMRQDDLETRILVERAGIDELSSKEGVLDGSIDPRREWRGSGRPRAAESVGYAIHLMKDDWIVQFLNARQERREGGIEYVITPLDGVR